MVLLRGLGDTASRSKKLKEHKFLTDFKQKRKN